MTEQSLASSIALLPEKQRLQAVNSLSEKEAEALLYDWRFWARPKQLAPDWDWYIWLQLCGRGGGKTRSGAEWVIECAMAGFSPIALVGQTKADVRDTMVEVGDSSILKVCPPWFVPDYESSKRRLTFPNGVLAIIYSGDEPDQLRGPQHCFVAGTLIATPHGEQPIETIQYGDYVLTRRGKRRVVEAFSRDAEVGRVKFSNGAELVATRQHRVLQLYGWMRIGELKKGAIVCTGERLLTDTSQPTSVEKRSTSIGGYGNNITGLSQRALKFITRIGIRSTTILAIYISRQSPHMFACMTELGKELWLSAQTVGQALLGLESIPVFQCASGVNIAEQRNRENLHAPANTAVENLSQEKETTVVSVVSTWERVGWRWVYNLTVEGQPEYIANGIIVHNCKAWVDELAKFKYAKDSWDNLMLGLRIGDNPQAVVTTTPKPIKIIKDLVADERTEARPGGRVAVTRGHTLENKDNLAPPFLIHIMRTYGGTRLGRQELAAEILDDNPNALWTRENIDADRLTETPELKRVVVAIDPQGTEGDEDSDTADTGIMVGGVGMVGGVPHAFILADLTINGSPDKWARAAVSGYHTHKADRIVAEVNFGGDMVKSTVKTVDSLVPFKAVHASRGKAIRAEPASALYEQHRVHHIGFFPDLEDQLVEWVPGMKSPDRLDALVWLIYDLILEEQGKEFMVG